MHLFYKLCFIIVLGCFLGGCSSKDPNNPSDDDLPQKPSDDTVNLPENYPIAPSPTLDGVKYIWERAAIGLETYSTSALNLYEDQSHNLMICMYQTADLNSINNMISQIGAGDISAMQKLLSCQKFDDSIVTSKRIFITVKQHKVQYFDREKDVKHVVMVAGYNDNLSTENIIIRDIPIKYAKVGVIFKDEEFSVAPLNMRIFVGSKKIQDLRGGESFRLYEKKEQNKENYRTEKIIEDYRNLESNL